MLPCATASSTDRAHRRLVALVADDEPLVRGLIRRILTESGWAVIEAIDAIDAYRQARSGPIGLLIADHEMPGERGCALARQLRRSRPGLPVLLISGLHDVAAIAEQEGASFLGKPFRPQALRATVEALVGAVPPEPGP